MGIFTNWPQMAEMVLSKQTLIHQNKAVTHANG